MDLTSLAVSGTSRLVIKHPITGADTDIVVELCGKDSDEYRKAYTEMVKLISVDPNNKETDYAKLESEIYAACTVNWENIDLDGKPLECTPKNVQMLYGDNNYVWLHEQVIKFVGDRVNFMQPS